MQAPTYQELLEAHRAQAQQELRLEGIEADAWANRAAIAALTRIANEITDRRKDHAPQVAPLS